MPPHMNPKTPPGVSKKGHVIYVPPHIAQKCRQIWRAPEFLHPLNDNEAAPFVQSLDIAKGTSIDWAKAKLGIKYTFSIEMRPRNYEMTDVLRGRGGFLLNKNQLIPVAEETWDAVKVVAVSAFSDKIE